MPCDATVAANFNHVSGCVAIDSLGGDLISKFYAIGGSSSGHSMVSDIIASGYIEAFRACTSSVLQLQGISVNCNNVQVGDAVRNGPNCVLCKQFAATLLADRRNIDASLGLAAEDLTQDTQLALYGTVGGTTFDNGLCKYVCKQCVVENVSQDMAVKVTSQCNLLTPASYTAVLSGMQQRARDLLTKNADAFRLLNTSINTTSDINKYAMAIASTLQSLTTTKTIQKIHASALAVQDIQILDQSTSLILENVSQSMTLNMMVQLVSKEYSESEIKAAISYDVRSQQYDYYKRLKELQIKRSSVNTSIAYDASAFKNTVSSLYTQAIFTVLFTVLAGILLIAFYHYFQLTRSEWNITHVNSGSDSEGQNNTNNYEASSEDKEVSEDVFAED